MRPSQSANNMDDKYQCDCGWFGTVEDMTAKEHRSNDHNMPSEWTYHCHDCGRDSDKMKEFNEE